MDLDHSEATFAIRKLDGEDTESLVLVAPERETRDVFAKVINPAITLSDGERIDEGWKLSNESHGCVFTHERGYKIVFHTEKKLSCFGTKKTEATIFDVRFQFQLLDDYSYSYVQGYQSWNLNKSIKTKDRRKKSLVTRLTPFIVGMFKDTDHPTWYDKSIIKQKGMDSFDALIFGTTDKEDFLLFGFTTCKMAQGAFWIHTKQRRFKTVDCVLHFGNHNKAYDVTLEETFVALYSSEELAPCMILERYAEESKQLHDTDTERNSELIKMERSPVGFSSWYQFYENVTAEDIDRMLKEMKCDERINKAIDAVQLDDGFQLNTGDWLQTRSQFGEKDLGVVAKNIRDDGHVPGIWIAPFIVSKTSRIAKEHPDWLLRNSKNKKVIAHVNPAWKRGCNLLSIIHYILDPSNPAVLEHLESIFKTLTKDWDWFKIDFLAAGMRDGVRFDPKQTRVEAYINGMKAIRKGAGPDAFILACGAPILATAQSATCDAMRVTCDTYEGWKAPALQRFFVPDWDNLPSCETSLWGNITRMHMHKRLFPLNDPDCMLLRDEGSSITDYQVRTQVTILGLTGGLLLFTDDLQKLEHERLVVGLKVLPSSPLQGRACHLTTAKRPDAFLMKGENAHVKAFINWKKGTKRSDISTEYGGFEFWTKKIVPNGKFKHEGYQVCALQFPVKPSLLLGNTLHLTAIADGRIVANDEQIDHEVRRCTITGNDNMSITEGELVFAEAATVVSSEGVTASWSEEVANGLYIEITEKTWKIVVETVRA